MAASYDTSTFDRINQSGSARTQAGGDGPEQAPGAPDWDKVPFPVACARCGQDLRGRAEPKCPVCELEFDWADAIPIEHLKCVVCDYHLYGLIATRCPECGTPFTWEEALARHHRQRLPFFEYQWHRRPFRSLVCTLFRSLRPGKFWRALDIHDPPRAGPLTAQAMISLAVVAASYPMVKGFYAWVGWRISTARMRWRPPPLSDLPLAILETAKQPASLRVCVATVTWFATTFAALMVFRQSMRLCRVRTIHIYRVWAHVVPPALPILLLFFMATEMIIDLTWGRYFHGLSEAVFLVGYFLFVTWSIRQGYRHYLRMPHSPGVALAAMIIASLGFMIVLSRLALWL